MLEPVGYTIGEDERRHLQIVLEPLGYKIVNQRGTFIDSIVISTNITYDSRVPEGQTGEWAGNKVWPD